MSGISRYFFHVAQCEHGCKHGECVGPNKCKCFPGYTGKTCNQGRYYRSVRKGVENKGQREFRLMQFPVVKAYLFHSIFN